LPIVGVHGFGFAGPRTRDLQSLAAGAVDLFGGRSILDVDTVLVFADTPASRLFAQVLITFLVFTGGAIILYLILMVIFSAARGNSDRISQNLTSRPLYIFIRFLDLSYLPLVTFGAAQLTIVDPWGTSGMAILAAVVGLAILGIAVPLILQVLVSKVKSAELFKDNYLLKLYSYYGAINHKKINFAFLPWARRFALGLVWGFATSSIVAQLVLSLIIQLIYIIVIFITSPYTDYLQQFADVIISIISLLAFVPLFAFTVPLLTTTAITAGTLIFVILTVIAAVAGIGFFIYSWCQMAGIFSLTQCKEKCCCGK
jgi:phage shock protein PspC (stress-responsive transcriptional regulator)